MRKVSRKTIRDTNLEYLANSPAPQPITSFARVRSLNDKTSAITHDGDRVERQEFLYIDGYGIVPCANYELHFLYIDPRSLDTDRRIKGRWGIMCTCGSMAGVISLKEVKSLMTVDGMSGYIIGCIAHTDSKQKTGVGRHADGSTE